MSNKNDKKQPSDNVLKRLQEVRQKIENSAKKLEKKNHTLTPTQIANLNESKDIESFPDATEVLKQDLNVAYHADFIFCSPRSKKLREARTRYTKEREQVLVVSTGVYITHENGKTITETRTPTIISAQIYFAILQLWYEQGRQANGYVTFSGRDIYKILDIKAGKTSYNILKRELAILKSAVIHWQYKSPSPSGVISTTEEINLLSYNARIKKEDLKGGTKFIERFLVQIDERIIKSTLVGYTKIFQQREYLRIAKESYDAAILYSKLDNYLTVKNRVWRREITPLLTDLGIEGSRYSLSSKRREKVEELCKILDKAKLSIGRLKVTIKNGRNDLLLYAERVVFKEPKTYNIHQNLGSENTKFLIEEMVKWIGFEDKTQPNGSRSLVSYYAKTYPEKVILDALSRFRSDAKDDPKVRSKKAIFTIYLHREVHRNGLRWVGKCTGKDCKHQLAFTLRK